jgi:hypothetical protein
MLQNTTGHIAPHMVPENNLNVEENIITQLIAIK